jgi:hypothetical protein
VHELGELNWSTEQVLHSARQPVQYVFVLSVVQSEGQALVSSSQLL